MRQRYRLKPAQSLHTTANTSARDLESLFLKLFLDFATAIDLSIGTKSSRNLSFECCFIGFGRGLIIVVASTDFEALTHC